MQQAIRKEGPISFPWQRCLWREDPLKWQTYSYHYVGPEKVVSAEGKEYAAHRFDITPVGEAAPTETVWVDEAGLPLRRLVPGMNNFEMLVSEKDRQNDLSDAPVWADAETMFGKDKAALTILAADIAF
jgi:hypothetical protein